MTIGGKNSMKQLTVNKPSAGLTTTVNLPGEAPDARLTPKMARRAARIATGGESGVTVWDVAAGVGYRLYSDKRNSHRKITIERGDGFDSRAAVSAW